MDASLISAIAGTGAMLVAVASALFARKQWLHKNRNWLYIPAPDVLRQDPAEPAFWVFPPFELDDCYALVIVGKLVNAGPADAFSVRVYADPEVHGHAVRSPFWQAIDIADAHTAKPRLEVERTFVGAYMNADSLIPVLRVGESKQFAVVAKFDKDDAYIRSITQEDAGQKESCAWEHERRQAHRVHAASRTILSGTLEFGPSDLCAPFEPR